MIKPVGGSEGGPFTREDIETMLDEVNRREFMIIPLPGHPARAPSGPMFEGDRCANCAWYGEFQDHYVGEYGRGVWVRNSTMRCTDCSKWATRGCALKRAFQRWTHFTHSPTSMLTNF